MKKIIFCVVCILGMFSMLSYSNENIEDLKFEGVVNTELLNIRQGPGTNYKITGNIKKNEMVNILGKMDEWYIVQTNENIIGVCNSEYISNYDEYSIKDRILVVENEYRKENGIKELELNDRLCEIAQTKLDDMLNNNYFGHVSVNLGSPVEMLDGFEVEYMTVGENLSRGYELEETINKWMESETQKDNILSNGYNQTGIAVLDTKEYGKVYVQIFIGK